MCCQEVNDYFEVSSSYLATIQFDGSGFTKLSLSLPQGIQLLDMTVDSNDNIWLIAKSSDGKYELYELDSNYAVKNCFALNDPSP